MEHLSLLTQFIIMKLSDIRTMLLISSIIYLVISVSMLYSIEQNQHLHDDRALTIRRAIMIASLIIFLIALPTAFLLPTTEQAITLIESTKE